MATPRRTQAQRRADTEAKLIEATIGSIVEIGYGRTTVKEICRRAGISHGGLFGRFETLFDLVVAAAVEVGRRQIESFTTGLARLTDPEDLGAVLELLRDNARKPINVVWIELTIAARTDPVLRAKLAPVRAEYGVAIAAAAERIPVLRSIPAEVVPYLGAIVLQRFDGDAIADAAYPEPEHDGPSLRVFTAVLDGYLRSLSGS
ncbi:MULTISPECIES: TetR/AcrR family transcriptional regulator [unclassified Nocardia]|uniref:TetR/AcrR family transcriptional regulator n=1 Tax=unclassified Nocardia TaxID=2637762 RepID=UPI001CE44D3D|nr:MULTISPECIES: TetR/AcrR family transcriptional regulator [unclassified Nocardia]